MWYVYRECFESCAYYPMINPVDSSVRLVDDTKFASPPYQRVFQYLSKYVNDEASFQKFKYSEDEGIKLNEANCLKFLDTILG